MNIGDTARAIGAALISIVLAPAAEAAPVKLTCTPISPQRFAIYGLLSVEVDLAARRVEIEAEKMPGYRWRIENNRIGAVLIATPKVGDDSGGVSPAFEQFVSVGPKVIAIGYRLDFQTVYVATFDRAAVDYPGSPCRWKSPIKTKLA
jgi:hypothetical protein